MPPTGPTAAFERAYEPRDLVAVHGIELEAGGSAWTRRELESVLGLPQTATWVLARSDRPSEIVAFYVVTRRRDELYLANLAVRRKHRRRGLATFALERVEDHARRLGMARIALDVQEQNLAAQICYRSAGFRAVAIRPGFYGDQDGYRMVKRLGVRALAAPGAGPGS